MPACGKSTLGKSLSEKLKYVFIDLDNEIEKHENKIINDIFKEHSEEYFRTIENKILNNLLKEPKTVISTGGGTPCFFDNMEKINENGITIFLDVPNDVLSKRIMNDKNKRPMFINKSEEEIKIILDDLLIKRINFYQQAHYSFDITTYKIEDIILKLKTHILYK